MTNPAAEPTELWLPASAGGGDRRTLGAYPAVYLTFGVLFAVITVLLFVGLNGVLVITGVTGGNSVDLGTAVLTVAGFGIPLAFVAVLWPLAFASQVVIAVELARRSRLAPNRHVRVDRIVGYSSAGTLDVLVPTRFSDRWNAIGFLGWLPGWRMILGAWAVSMGIETVGIRDVIRLRAGVPDSAPLVVATGLLVVGIALLVWGIPLRYPKVKARFASDAEVAARERVSAARSDRRQELRRAKLTPEQRADEDAKLAAFTTELRERNREA